MPGAPSSFLLLVARPGAPSSVLFLVSRSLLAARAISLEGLVQRSQAEKDEHCGRSIGSYYSTCVSLDFGRTKAGKLPSSVYDTDDTSYEPLLRLKENRFTHSYKSCLLGARTLLGAPGLATRNKNATRGSWPYY